MAAPFFQKCGVAVGQPRWGWSWCVYVDYVYHDHELWSNIGENSALTTKSLKAFLWSQVKESSTQAGDLFGCIDGAEMKESVMQWFAPSTSANHQAPVQSTKPSAKPSWRRNSHALTYHSVCCREWTLHQDQTSSLQKWQWIFFQWAHMLI